MGEFKTMWAVVGSNLYITQVKETPKTYLVESSKVVFGKFSGGPWPGSRYKKSDLGTLWFESQQDAWLQILENKRSNIAWKAQEIEKARGVLASWEKDLADTEKVYKEKFGE